MYLYFVQEPEGAGVDLRAGWNVVGVGRNGLGLQAQVKVQVLRSKGTERVMLLQPAAQQEVWLHSDLLVT